MHLSGTVGNPTIELVVIRGIAAGHSFTDRLYEWLDEVVEYAVDERRDIRVCFNSSNVPYIRKTVVVASLCHNLPDWRLVADLWSRLIGKKSSPANRCRSKRLRRLCQRKC